MSTPPQQIEEDILKSINFKCPKHSSDIGGLCSDITCYDQSQMKCIKCISETSCCVKAKNHKLVSISEFTDSFFHEHYLGLKQNYNTCKSVNNVENLCRNTQLIINTFNQKKTEIKDCLDMLYQQFIQRSTGLYNDLVLFYNEFLTAKEVELKQGLLRLNVLINYDALEGFDVKELKDKMLHSPFESLNAILIMMKKTVSNLSDRKNKEDEAICKSIINIKNDKCKEMFNESFNNINQSLNQMFNEFKFNIQNELFREEVVSLPQLSQLKEIHNCTIDYSTNSQFTHKQFEFYTHSNGHSYIAYPSSLNAIRIEDFSDVLGEDKRMVTSNNVIHQDINVNVRDKILLFKLVGHLAQINKIIYHRVNDQDYLVSSSNDQTVRIWNITHLNDYLTNPNDYYTDDNVKALKGHKGKVISLEVFNDPNTGLNYVISIGLNDKVKIWDLTSGELVRELYDRNSISKGTLEEKAMCINIDSVNYMITYSNANHIVKIWDFDAAKVLNVVQYPFANHNIVKCCYYKSQNKILLIDDKGPSVSVEIREKKEPILVSMNMLDYKTERNGCLFWDKDILLIYTKNGMIYEYDLEETKVIDKKRIVDHTKSITHLITPNYFDKKIILTHTEDQHLRVFSLEKAQTER